MANNVQITQGSGTTIATREDAGSVHTPLVLSGGLSRSETFTTAANGTTVDASVAPVSRFGLQVKKTGDVASYTVLLEVSLDGTNWVTLLTHDSAADADGSIVWTAGNFTPALYFRARCSAISLGSGTNVIATIVGM